MRLTTERLIIRDYTFEDADAVYTYQSDEMVVEDLPWAPFDRQTATRFVQKAMHQAAEVPRVKFDLAMCVNGNENLIGGCGIFVTSIVNREGSICYWLGRPYWGKGYATEAAKALLNYAFTELGLHRITATCSPGNLRSKRVLGKLGMEMEGVLRGHVWQRTHWRDSDLFSILDKDWAYTEERVTKLLNPDSAGC